MYFLGPKVRNAICDGAPITYTLKLINKSTVKCRGHKSSNGIDFCDSFKFYSIFSDLGPQLWERRAGGVSGGMGCPHMHVNTHMQLS